MVKIGHSQNVSERMTVLQKSSGQHLELLGVMAGGRKLQKQYEAYRTDDDEWFNAEFDLMNYIRKHAHALDLPGED